MTNPTAQEQELAEKLNMNVQTEQAAKSPEADVENEDEVNLEALEYAFSFSEHR